MPTEETLSPIARGFPGVPPGNIYLAGTRTPDDIAHQAASPVARYAATTSRDRLPLAALSKTTWVRLGPRLLRVTALIASAAERLAAFLYTNCWDPRRSDPDHPGH